MNIATRWYKLFRDFRAIGGRITMMVAAIAVGVFSVTTIVSTYAILTREISRNYLETNPASALIDLGEVNPSLVDQVRSRPDIGEVEAGSIITARVKLKNDEWGRLLLFVVPDFGNLTINKVFPQAGAYPPRDQTILVERETLAFLGSSIGDAITMQTPSGQNTQVVISGTVHDPALAPSWKEQTAYAYLTPDTLAALGHNPVPELLKVVVKGAVFDQGKVDSVATRLGLELRAQGLSAHQIQVPPTGKHPHQSQMTAVLAMFIVFAFLALVLSAVLTASMVDGLLAQQVRQIAVMKAIGARYGQITGLYLTGILAISTAAVLIGVPLGLLCGRSFAQVIAQLLNFNIASSRLPSWLIPALAGGGMFIPAAFALTPISRATRRTVRESLNDYGVSSKEFGTYGLDVVLSKLGGLDRTLILALRNAFRRRSRMILTLSLLGIAGAMFMASLNVKTAWEYFVASSAKDRGYDLELRLDHSVPTVSLLAAISGAEGVGKVEPWSLAKASVARPDGLTVMRTYPDGGHGNLEFRSMPEPGSLDHLVFLEGRPPAQGEIDEVLLNQSARTLLGDPHAGDVLRLTVEGHSASYRIAGIVRQIVTPPAVFVSGSGFSAATRTSSQTNAVRISTTCHTPEAIAATSAAVEARLLDYDIHIALSISETQVGGAVGGHVKILIVSLIVMSMLMATVGLLGLASALGSNVAERTREFGIMRTIGGTSSVVIRNVLAEGVFTGLVSIALSIVLALPLAIGIGKLVGTLSFGLPLPFMQSWTALGLWSAFIVFGTAGASLVPALRASRLTIRQTLAYT